jgi:hypothetical protein
MNIPTIDKRHLDFAVLPHWVAVGSNKRAGWKKYDQKSGVWEGQNALGMFVCPTESEVDQPIRQHPCKPPKATREPPKGKAPEKPEGLAAGGLTKSDASLGLFDSLRKLAGLVTASPGGRYRLRTKTVDRMFDTQAEAMVAGTRTIRDEEATAKAAKKRAKAEAPTNVGPTP